MKYIATVDGKDFAVDVQEGAGEGQFTVTIGDRSHQVDLATTASNWLFSLILDGRSHQIVSSDGAISVDGEDHMVEVTRDLGAGAPRRGAVAEGPAKLKPPIPGLIVSIEVAVGDEVRQGQTVVILEAMKMQMELKSPRSGHVTEVLAQPKQEVGQAQVLLIIGD